MPEGGSARAGVRLRRCAGAGEGGPLLQVHRQGAQLAPQPCHLRREDEGLVLDGDARGSWPPSPSSGPGAIRLPLGSVQAGQAGPQQLHLPLQAPDALRLLPYHLLPALQGLLPLPQEVDQGRQEAPRVALQGLRPLQGEVDRHRQDGPR